MPPDPVREAGRCDARVPGRPSDYCDLRSGHEGRHEHDDGRVFAHWPNPAASSSKDEEGGLWKALVLRLVASVPHDHSEAVAGSTWTPEGVTHLSGGNREGNCRRCRLDREIATFDDPAPSVSQQGTGDHLLACDNCGYESDYWLCRDCEESVIPKQALPAQQGTGERATAVERITTVGEARDLILGELKAPPAGRAPEQYARDIAFKLRDFGYLASVPSQQKGGGVPPSDRCKRCGIWAGGDKLYVAADGGLLCSGCFATRAEAAQPCPTCDTPMVHEVGEGCPNPNCDYVVAEPDPEGVNDGVQR